MLRSTKKEERQAFYMKMTVANFSFEEAVQVKMYG